jgi:hypothetical protein
LAAGRSPRYLGRMSGPTDDLFANAQRATDVAAGANRVANIAADAQRAVDIVAGAKMAVNILASAQGAASMPRGPALSAEKLNVIRGVGTELFGKSAGAAIAPVGLLSIDRSIREAVNAWQGQLLRAKDLNIATNAVSRSVAEALASRQTHMSDTVRTLATAGVVLKPGILSTGRALQELSAALESPFKEIARQTRATHLALVDALRPAALAAVSDWADTARLLSGRSRAALAALRRDGWWVAPSWDVTTSPRLVALRQEEGKRALDREICSMYREGNCRALREMVGSWDDEPAFRVRRAIIREALKLHRERRYKASIPMLLPLVEGIAVDVFAPGVSGKSPKNVYRDGVDPAELDQMFGEALLFTLGVLYESVPFATLNPRARTWNRHVVLHGRSINYASEANSLRVFLTLEQLAYQIRAKRRQDDKIKVASA